ncbi:MAG: Hpt domain-containing protein [Bdellovibrionota bacterium]
MKVTLNPRLKELVPSFLESLEDYVLQLEGAVAKRDLTTVKRIGHMIKGDCASFGVSELSALGAAVEDAAADARWDVIEERARVIRTVVGELEIII